MKQIGAIDGIGSPDGLRYGAPFNARKTILLAAKIAVTMINCTIKVGKDKTEMGKRNF